MHLSCHYIILRHLSINYIKSRRIWLNAITPGIKLSSDLVKVTVSRTADLSPYVWRTYHHPVRRQFLNPGPVFLILHNNHIVALVCRCEICIQSPAVPVCRQSSRLLVGHDQHILHLMQTEHILKTRIKVSYCHDRRKSCLDMKVISNTAQPCSRDSDLLYTLMCIDHLSILSYIAFFQRFFQRCESSRGDVEIICYRKDIIV